MPNRGRPKGASALSKQPHKVHKHQPHDKLDLIHKQLASDHPQSREPALTMRVFPIMLDAAISEILNPAGRTSMRRLEVDLALACLFASETAILDVFLFNNESLERHTLERGRRSIFTEGIRSGVINIYTRAAFNSYEQTLHTIEADTVQVAPTTAPLSIKPQSMDMVERLSTTAPTPRTRYLPSSGHDSWAESLASLYEVRGNGLISSPNRDDRIIGPALHDHLRGAETLLSHVDTPGMRRSFTVWHTARDRTNIQLPDSDFLYNPYHAIFYSLSDLEKRRLLRREMLEVTLLYLVNLASRFNSALYYTKIAAPREHQYLVHSFERSLRELTGWQETVARLKVKLPTMRAIIRTGPEMLDLRALGVRYFEDLALLDRGNMVPVEQIEEDLRPYTRAIRKEVDGSTSRVLTASAGLGTIASILHPAFTVAAGAMSGISSARFRSPINRKIIVYRVGLTRG